MRGLIIMNDGITDWGRGGVSITVLVFLVQLVAGNEKCVSKRNTSSVGFAGKKNPRTVVVGT